MNIQLAVNKIKDDKILNNLVSFFDNDIYLVGGSVRDYFMGKTSYDRDLIVTDIDAGEFAQNVAQFFDGKFIPLDVENHIYRVVLPDKINYFDITNPIENSLKKDIMRRDLTINSVAINLKTDEVIDYANGLNDLKNGILRCIKKENISDDYLRILRVFRFNSLLGFDIEQHTQLWLKEYANKVLNPAKERIHYELMKLFSGKYSHKTLLKMDDLGILETLFPFVKELKQVPKNSHHHLDLFHHSIETVKQVNRIYENADLEVEKHLNNIDISGFPRIAYLKLSAFMHDIGKFSTWTIEEDTKRHRFIMHDEVGAKLAKTYLKSRNFSNKEIEYISLMIHKHIYPASVVSCPELNSKIMMRYIRKMNNNCIDNIVLAQADRLSARGKDITQEIIDNNINGLNKLLNYYLEVRQTLKPLPKLIDGNEIMQILNIPPCEKLGQILSQIKELQISGEINTKEEAIDFVKRFE